MRFAGVDLATAVAMATHNPARLLGRPANHLLPGDPADLTFFDVRDGTDGGAAVLDVRATFAYGEQVYAVA